MFKALEKPENMILTVLLPLSRCERDGGGCTGWCRPRQAETGPEMEGLDTTSLDEGHQGLGGTSLGLGQDRMCSKGLELSSDKCSRAT